MAINRIFIYLYPATDRVAPSSDQHASRLNARCTYNTMNSYVVYTCHSQIANNSYFSYWQALDAYFSPITRFHALPGGSSVSAMNLHSTRSLLSRRAATVIHQHVSRAKLSTRHANFTYLFRTYATHRDPPISKQSPGPLLSHTLDQRAGARQRDNVGPFQLGLIPPTPRDGASQKKWSELSTGGKGA